MKDLEAGIRKIEQEIRGVRTPSGSAPIPRSLARADDMVSKLESAIAEIEAELDKARAAGNEKKVRELESNLSSRRSFLEMARRAAEDFG